MTDMHLFFYQSLRRPILVVVVVVVVVYDDQRQRTGRGEGRAYININDDTLMLMKTGRPVICFFKKIRRRI